MAMTVLPWAWKRRAKPEPSPDVAPMMAMVEMLVDRVGVWDGRGVDECLFFSLLSLDDVMAKELDGVGWGFHVYMRNGALMR